jgi:8-oxo-dGTP diphosphatase
LIKDGHILLGKRKAAHGAGEYAGPGGHLELHETFEQCILRELAEEAGPDVKIKALRLLCVTNLLKYHPKHYVDIGMIAEWVSGQPKVIEPHKLEAWEWHPIDNPPAELFAVLPNYLEAFKTGQHYFATT